MEDQVQVQTITTFGWDDLGQYKANGKFLDGYPTNLRTFFSPEDQIHPLLVSLLSGTTNSLVLNMYGYDDDELNALVLKAAANPKIYVQMSLDKSQAGGVHEKKLLTSLQGQPGCNIAIGTSTKHAISHLKIAIIDGVYVISGSTNWSLSGEGAQDNQLTVTKDAVLAAETRSILDRNHTAMLRQMGVLK